MLAWLTGALPAVDAVFGHAAAAGIGTVLLIGAVDKLREPEVFRDALENYALLPDRALPVVARALPLAELCAGALLLPLATRAAGALLAFVVLLAVTAAVVINLRRGRDGIDCGCGGAGHIPLSRGLVARNGLLLLLVVVAALPVAPRSTVWLDLVAVGFATLFLLGLYFLANSMLAQQSRLLDLRNSP